MICERDVHDPVMILHAAVCEACERELVATWPADAGYHRFVERFRVFWQAVAEAAASSEAGE